MLNAESKNSKNLLNAESKFVRFLLNTKSNSPTKVHSFWQIIKKSCKIFLCHQTFLKQSYKKSTDWLIRHIYQPLFTRARPLDACIVERSKNFSLIITLITPIGLQKPITIIRIILTINFNNDDNNSQTKRLSLVDKTAFSGRQNGFLWQRKRLSL